MLLRSWISNTLIEESTQLIVGYSYAKEMWEYYKKNLYSKKKKKRELILLEALDKAPYPPFINLLILSHALI